MNSCFCLGNALPNTLGLLILPESEGSQDVLKDDKNWRIVYGAPVVICHAIPLIIISIFFKHPSIRELLGTLKENEESKVLDSYLARIFLIGSEQDMVRARV